jgi:hypothetical protein
MYLYNFIQSNKTMVNVCIYLFIYLSDFKWLCKNNVNFGKRNALHGSMKHPLISWQQRNSFDMGVLCKKYINFVSS